MGVHYFSHDVNARRDEKVMRMRSKYGLEGFGLYWIIVEMLSEQKDYTRKLNGEHSCKAIALEAGCEPEKVQQFLEDSVKSPEDDGFGLFKTDGKVFWSESLVRRMSKRDDVIKKRQAAAQARWSAQGAQCKSNANAKQVHKSGSSSSSSSGGEGKKPKKKKVEPKPEAEPKKLVLGEFVSLTVEEYRKLCDKYGEEATSRMVEILDNYKGSSGKTYKSDYRTILNWVVDRYEKEKAQGVRRSKTAPKGWDSASRWLKNRKGEKHEDTV